MAGGRGPHLGRAGDRNLIALLSLKLMLLAFFIVLTTMADRGVDRSDAVIESVKRSFQGLTLSGEEARGVGGEPALGPLDGIRPLIERIGRIFGSQLSLSEGARTASGLTFKLDLPVEALLDPSDRQVTTKGTALLKRLATALGAADAERRFYYEIDVLMRRTPDGGVGGRTQPPARLSARLTHALMSAGIPAERVAAGLTANAPENKVRLVLRFFETRPARLGFAPALGNRGIPGGGAE